jgi:hypothetical protein
VHEAGVDRIARGLTGLILNTGEAEDFSISWSESPIACAFRMKRTRSTISGA